MNRPIKISILGSGNVAYHMTNAILSSGNIVECVYGRNVNTLGVIQKEYDIHGANTYQDIPVDSDIYLIAVKDDSIIDVAAKLKKQGVSGIICHCSGSFDSHKLLPFSENYGSFYPLQSFSINRKLNYASIPICIHANTKSSQNLLLNLAKQISNNVRLIDEATRQKLHLAAVFVNNFTNHMLTLAQGICEDEKLDFSILQPLLLETVGKLDSLNPREAQTGPALRRDSNTLEAHQLLLSDNSSTLDIYDYISSHIQTYHEISRRNTT